ncbi:hypothetical protein [Streptomyces sp. NPDC005507]|uniref:hypothetical protein n=1 Tax=unclassified Streptomyces TaxID=2593676 RepID=UPI0033B90C39
MQTGPPAGESIHRRDLPFNVAVARASHNDLLADLYESLNVPLRHTGVAVTVRVKG